MFGAGSNSPTSTEQASRKSPAALAKHIAAGAIEVIGSNDRPALPFDRDERTVAILLKPFETPIEPPEQPLGAALRARFPNSEYVQLGPRADAAAYDVARKLAPGAKQTAVAIIVRPAAWYAFGLQPQQKQLVRELLSRRDDLVLACLGVPTALDEFPEAAVRICTYSDVSVSQQALVEFLCGGN
jgi:hypothetical protein